MAESGYLAAWPGAMGIITNGDLQASCTWSEELLLSTCEAVGIAKHIVPARAMMRECCTIADLCDDPALLGAPEADVRLFLHFLAAPDWCMTYWFDCRLRTVWSPSHLCVALRHLAMGRARWDDTEVADLMAQFRRRDWCTMCRSDMVALALAMSTMAPEQRDTFRAVATASVKHAIQSATPQLMEGETLAMLRDMVTTAHGAGVLDITDVRGDLHCACLAHVLVTCGHHAAEELADSSCLHHTVPNLIAWLPTFIYAQGWAGAWCEAVYGSMEPAKVLEEYLRQCPDQCVCVGKFARAWRKRVESQFFKFWYIWNNHISAML